MELSSETNNLVAHPPLWSNLYYHRKRLREEIEEVVEKYLKPRCDVTLVDYGCGTKPYENTLEPFLSEYIGLDIVDRPEVDQVLSDDGTSALADGTADAVLSSMVLEHVPDPELYLQECKRIMKPDGVLFLLTHGHMIYHPTPGDYWRWTSSGLEKKVNENGFLIREKRGIMNVPSTAAQFLLDSLRPLAPKFMHGAINLIMQGVIGLMDSNMFGSNREKDSCVFFIVAKCKR
ncbi:SAM-dependent methyltransferase [Salinibacter ruber]|uniref:class I SAM-dependent methyltransferase n=1 Tax=Salinibacter ruber TaxID=146919 RepID=UPI0021688485|nr:class I SAM-dependent methyltransferase [Salinibacter ruber]MCS3827483.1 SAM-dependent methyltransferase [Salinibacter ruber]